MDVINSSREIEGLVDEVDNRAGQDCCCQDEVFQDAVPAWARAARATEYAGQLD